MSVLNDVSCSLCFSFQDNNSEMLVIRRNRAKFAVRCELPAATDTFRLTT